MLVYIKHLVLFAAYLLVCIYILVTGRTSTIAPFASMGGMYYSVLAFPRMNQLYEYNLVERTVPKVTYVLRGAFHYLLFKHHPPSSFAAVLSVFMVLWFKDIRFLIRHAETRLGKIHDILYEEGIGKRIAHLHLRTYGDDINNRFHVHCFDCNRLYLEDYTLDASTTALAIHNYRCIRRDRKTPRSLTDAERVAWYASSNEAIFVSQRSVFLLTPLCVLVCCMVATKSVDLFRVYVNHSVLLLDLATVRLAPKWNDVVVDMSYYLGLVVVLLVSSTASS